MIDPWLFRPRIAASVRPTSEVESERDLTVDFMPEAELWCHVARVHDRRVQELVAQGVPRPHARQQAEKEFSIYDRVEVDDRGWMRLQDFEVSEGDQ